MGKYVFLLSGEHPGLAFSELKSVISCVGGRVVRLHERLAVSELSEERLRLVSTRLSYTKVVSLLLCMCSVEEALGRLRAMNIPVGRGESFAFRVMKLDRSVGVPSPVLERVWGGLIAERGFRVDLENPDHLFLGFIYEGRLVVSLLVSTPSRDAKFSEREPSKRPFFHPSSMRPRLARCLVNLACCPGSPVLDPFCGVGGILIEACLMGHYSVGIDLDWKMLVGARGNLLHYGLRNYDLICGDSSKPPIRPGVSCVVTDPPYGRGSSTHGRLHSELILSMLRAVRPKRGVIVTYKGSEVEREVRALGFRVDDMHSIKVHRSLTRLVLRLVREGVD